MIKKIFRVIKPVITEHGKPGPDFKFNVLSKCNRQI